MLEESHVSYESSTDEYDSTFGDSFMVRNQDELLAAKSNWSPDTIPHCEVCLKTFTFRRRRHHCRKCGCIVCYKCSSQAIVIPRLGKGLQRVCDSCYNHVHCDPGSNLVEDCIEANLRAKMRQDTLRVGVITSCDVVVQAIVQGLSIAMTGSPLGKEIDVECFPSPPHWRHQQQQSTSIASSPSLRLPSGLHSRHSITPNSLQSMSMSAAAARRDIMSDLNAALASPDPGSLLLGGGVEEGLDSTATSRYIRSDTDSRGAAHNKAMLAYDMYRQRFGVCPDFSVAVVFGVCRDDFAEGRGGDSAGEVGEGGVMVEWEDVTGDECSSSPGHREEGREDSQCSPQQQPEVTSDLTYDGNSVGLLPNDSSSSRCRRSSSGGSSPRASTRSSSTQLYQMFYWVVMYDGEKMSSSRSSSISLPPSLCAHIQKRESDFARHNDHVRAMKLQRAGSEQSSAVKRSSSSHLQLSIFDCDIDVEEELVAAILREGDAAAATSDRSGRGGGGLSITNALSGGIVGWLTGGRITRASYLQTVIQLAYMPFQWKHLYEVTDV
jgi:hypothetical protein